MFGPDGLPLPTCIAWHCTVRTRPGQPMCNPCWIRVPQYIRQAILGERDAIRRETKGRGGPTAHLLALLNIAVEKEVARRIKEHPELAEVVKRENDELEAKRRAAVSPILDPHAQEQRSPNAPPLPPTIQVQT